MQDYEALEAAIHLIENEASWTKNASSRNANGEDVPYNDPTAVAWCATGALRRVTQDSIQGDFQFARLTAAVASDLANIFDAHPPAAVMCYNDHPSTTHEDIVLVMKKGLENLE